MTPTSPDPAPEIPETPGTETPASETPASETPTPENPAPENPTPENPAPDTPETSAPVDNTEAKPTEAKPVQEAVVIGAKAKTIPKSIRLWESAFSALKVLMGKYGKNLTDMASISIIAHAKKASAASIVKYRTLEDKILFALQASASDIKAGLSNFREDLYKARKSNRDPAALKAAYDALSVKYQATMVRAEETLALMDKECLLTNLLTGEEHEILMEMIKDLDNEKPTTQTEQKKRDLQLKILKALLP